VSLNFRHAASKAIPALLVEPDVKRPVWLVLVVRAVALEQAAGFMQGLNAEKLPGDRTVVGFGDTPKSGFIACVSAGLCYVFQ